MANRDLRPLKAQEWTEETARHLLNRAGFGVPDERVQQLARLSPERAVDSFVDFEPAFRAPGPDFLIPEERQRELRRATRDMSEIDRRKKRQELQRSERAAVQHLKAWWLQKMATTERPLEEKMTLFWHGHFATSAQKVRSSQANYNLNDTFRAHALGSFKELTLAVGQSPAMLRYLDNNRNVKGKPNENWARELMELFTMGVGNYTEEDIKESARAFTGWTFGRDGFVFRKNAHDEGTKNFLGTVGNLDGWKAIDAIFRQPVTAEFICRKLWRYFAYEEPKESIVRDLAQELRENSYAVQPVLRTLFLSRAFYSKEAIGTQIKSPAQFMVRVAHDLETDPVPYGAMVRFTAQLGQDLLYPPNVKGWDGDKAWINANTILLRYNMPLALIRASADAKITRDEGNMMMMETDRKTSNKDQKKLWKVYQDHMQTLEPAERRRIRAQMNESSSQNERRSMMQAALDGRSVKAAWNPNRVFGALKFTNGGECIDELSKRFLGRTVSDEQRGLLAEALGVADDLDARLSARQLSSPDMKATLRLLLSMAEYQLC